MSYETITEIANGLHKDGVKCYHIDENGFFDTTYRAPQMTFEITDPKWIGRHGDNLLRVFSDKGTVALRWPGVVPREAEGPEDEWLFRGAHIEVFGKTGLPLCACPGGRPVYMKSDPKARVWATYEIYPDEQRAELARYSDPVSEGEWGVKLRFADSVWQVGGRLDPGHSHNTIYQLKPKTR
jgi:hypothetical protein